MRRNITLGIGLAVVIASSGAGWAAGRQIRSPAEVAARTAPPIPSLISVPVEKRTLSSDVVIRGTVRYGAPQLVSLPTSALKKSNGIVTTAPVKGTEVGEGSVAMAISGRPVFVLQGSQPSHRDLGPGAVGEDVRQLEASLARLGFDPGGADGTYDGRTATAVAAWYRAAGWTALGPTDEQLQVQRTARTDLSQAQSELFVAQEGLASARASQTAATERAQVARAAARSAPAAEAAARAKADAERLAAAAEVAVRSTALETALGDERVAQINLNEARSAKPPTPPAELATLEAVSRTATSAVKSARAALVAAEAAAAAVAPPPAPGTAAAEAARVVTSADAEVVRAAEAVQLAQHRVELNLARAAPGPLADISRRLGTQVPADEVLFFPTLPLRIDEAKVKPGETLSGPVMTVTNSQLAIDAALSVADAKLVRKDAAVAIVAPELGIRASGTVSVVADTPGTRGVDPQRFYLEVTPADAPVSLLGATTLLTITVESTGGDVLAVPVAALSLAGDGTSRVQVLGPGRTTRFATVTPGLAAKGLVAVTPVGARLSPGDLVVVGSTAGAGGRPASQPRSTTTTTTTGGTNAP